VKRETVCGLSFQLGNNHNGAVWRFADQPGDNVCATCWNTRAVEQLDDESYRANDPRAVVRPWDEGRGNSGRPVKAGRR
jgi:hypothetical protein